MTTVQVMLKKPYSVAVGRGIFDSAGEIINEVCGAHKILVVTDTNVRPLHFEKVAASLQEAGFKTYEFVFEAGEKSKTVNTYLDIIDRLGAYGFKRTDAIVALGGGVVGDVAGFAAATYMRGIDVIQMPTTLLAMIDSSVGGKTGVDLEYGKNLLGAFHQPKSVIADIAALETLPRSEWKNGLGEGIKYACLAGGRILEILKSGLNSHNLEEFVALCVSYKADVVAADETERGQRKLLNFGHTVGHALEKLSGFETAHGEAVARGIMTMATAARNCGELDGNDFDTVAELLNRYGFECPPIDFDISEHISNDKKAEGVNGISYIAIQGIGKCVVRSADIATFARYISQK